MAMKSDGAPPSPAGAPRPGGAAARGTGTAAPNRPGSLRPRLAALDQLADLLPSLASDFLVERVAALVTYGDTALAACFRDRHRPAWCCRASVRAIPPRGARPL